VIKKLPAFVACAGVLLALAQPIFGQTKKIGMLPKFTSDPYFVAANQGAQEAAKELHVT
jgi:rhamnose transport system substrate-binding protein